jgi:hypothetical protein
MTFINVLCFSEGVLGDNYLFSGKKDATVKKAEIFYAKKMREMKENVTTPPTKVGGFYES